MVYCARCSSTGYLPQRVGRDVIRKPCRMCRWDYLAEQLYRAKIETSMGEEANSPDRAWNLLPRSEIDGWRQVLATAMTMER